MALNQPIGMYLRQGAKPRLVVIVTNPTTGAMVLTYVTKADATGDIQRSLKSFGQINQTILPEGGMAEVSTMSIEDLVLEKRLALCTEATLSPKWEGITRGVGRMLNSAASYSDSRNATTGDLDDVAIVVGRNFSDSGYVTVRGYFEVHVPADMTTCEEAFIPLAGLRLYSSETFGVVLVAGNWSSLDPGPTSGNYNNFAGWSASGDYSVTKLNEEWTTAEYVSGTNYIRLNEAGRNYLASCAGGIARFVLLSERDIDATGYGSGPTGQEFVMFATAGASMQVRYNSYRLDGCRIAVYYAFEDEAGNVPTDPEKIDPVWQGMIESCEHDDTTLALSCTQNDYTKNPKIPAKTITTDDYPNCPDGNIGAAIPVIYGDLIGDRLHKDGIASFLNGSNRYGNGAFAKALVYDDGGNTLSLIAAGHAIKNSSFMAAIYSSAINSFALVSGDAVNIIEDGTNTGKFTISPGATGTFPYKLTSGEDSTETAVQLQGIASYIPTAKNQSFPDDRKNAVNSDWSDWSEPSPEKYAYEYQFYNSYGESGLYNTLAVVFETYAENGYDDELKLEMYFYDKNNQVGERYIDIDSNGQHIFYMKRDEGFTLSNDTVRLEVFFSWPFHKSFKFRNLCILRGFSRDVDAEAYIPIQGRPDDSSGTITGIANALIENPTHVIEGIARNEVSLTGTEINTAEFDTAATATDGMKFAFQIAERQDAREIFEDLGKFCGLMVYWDRTGKLSVKQRKPINTGFPVSGTRTPALLDIFTSEPCAVDGSFTSHPILDALKISQAPLSDVKNKFIFNYCLNPATGEYTKTLTVDREGHTLTDDLLDGVIGDELVAHCSASYTRLQTENVYELNAWPIRDDATAHRCLQNIILWRVFRRNIVTLKTISSAISKNFGESINIRDSRIEERYGRAAMNTKEWVITKINPDLGNDTWELVVTEVETNA